MGCGCARPEPEEDPRCAHCKEEDGVRMFFGSKYCEKCYAMLEEGRQRHNERFEEQLVKVRADAAVLEGGEADDERGKLLRPEKKKKRKSTKGKGKEKEEVEIEGGETGNAEVVEEAAPPPVPAKKKKKLPPLPPPKRN